MRELKKYLERIEENFTEDEVVNLTQQLVRIPSHSRVEGRERDVAKYLGNYCQQQGLKVELVPIEGERKNVIIRLKGEGGGKTLLFNGHLDTVPPYEMDFNPFKAEIEDGYILGRGTGDMKGPIAAMITAILALKRSGIKLKGDVIFTAVIGEEEKSEGTEALIRSGIKADGAIVGEPSSGRYSIGHRGLEWLEIEIQGKAAHGGVPENGINAIEKANDLINAIREKLYPKLKERFNPRMGPSVMNFGVIQGGNQPSTVADRCTIQIDRRYISGETVETVIKEYQDLIDELRENDPDFKAVIHRIPTNMLTMDHLYLETDADDPIAVTIKDCIELVTAKKAEISEKRGWTDAGLLSNFAEIPTVVYGPGDIAYSHSRNEKIKISDLVDGVKIYSLAMIGFCQVV